MSEKRQDLRELADGLRGLDQQTVGQAREAGKQMAQQIGKMQTVTMKDISGPAATPKITQEQNATVRERHVTEKQQQNQVRTPGGAAKDKSLGEIAQSLRQAGVAGDRAANCISPAKQTPAVERKQSKGRGR